MDKTLDLHEENLKYLKLYAEGDESAAERLMELNMGLVNGIALRFRGRGTEMEDLVQIGSIGMLKAIRSFDLSRGTFRPMQYRLLWARSANTFGMTDRLRCRGLRSVSEHSFSESARIS